MVNLHLLLYKYSVAVGGILWNFIERLSLILVLLVSSFIFRGRQLNTDFTCQEGTGNLTIDFEGFLRN